MLVPARYTYQRWVIGVLIVTLAACAWILTISLGSSLMPDMSGMTDMQHMSGMMPMSGMAPMEGMQPTTPSGWVVDVPLFLAAWVLMTAAMMLPAARSMVDTFSALTAARPGAPARVATFILGYMLAWGGVGGAAYAVYLLTRMGIEGSAWFANHTDVLVGSTLLLAGLYQFAPLKRRCLGTCRSPLSFLKNHWRDGATGPLRMGAHHGVFCIGCCWALMLLMLAVGMTQLGWMLGLALLMFVEKVVRRGQLVGYGIGALFVPWGLLTLAGVIGPVGW